MAEMNDLAIAYEAEEGLGAPLPGAAGPLTLIAQEMIANAIEHGSRPERRARIELTLRREGQRSARLVVLDDGPGLPPDFRADASLGLKLVRALTLQTGADFRLANRPGGEGTAATLLIPLTPLTDIASPAVHRTTPLKLHGAAPASDGPT